jgi:hypothetical protein
MVMLSVKYLLIICLFLFDIRCFYLYTNFTSTGYMYKDLRVMDAQEFSHIIELFLLVTASFIGALSQARK